MAPKSNRKICRKRQNTYPECTYIGEHSLSWFDTSTSIKSGRLTKIKKSQSSKDFYIED